MEQRATQNLVNTYGDSGNGGDWLADGGGDCGLIGWWRCGDDDDDELGSGVVEVKVCVGGGMDGGENMGGVVRIWVEWWE